MPTTIHLATPDDAPRLSALAAATFRETFGGANTPEDMARYLADAFTPERQAAEIADPAGAVLLATHEARPDAAASTPAPGTLVGYAHLADGGRPPGELRKPAGLPVYPGREGGLGHHACARGPHRRLRARRTWRP